MGAKSNFLKQTYKNIVNGSLSIFIVALSSIVLTPIILSNLGKELYGLWLLTFNLLAYFYLTDFGVTNAIIRLFSKFNASRKEELYKLISTSYILIVLMSILMFVLLISIKNIVFNFLDIKEELKNIFTFIYYVGVIEIFTQFILRINIGVLKGKHRYDIAYNLEGIAAFSRLIVILILSWIDMFDIYIFTVVYAAIKIFSDGVSFYFLKSEIKTLRFLFDLKIYKELINIGSSSILISIFNLLLNSFPIILFGKYFGVINVVLLSIPFAVKRIVTRLVNTIYNGVNPRASELNALNQTEEINLISSYGVKLSILISLPIYGFFVIFGKEILYFWLGGTELNLNDLNIIYNILSIIFIYIFFENMYKVNIFIYRSSGYHWYVTLEMLLSTIILYVISYFLIDFLSVYIFAWAFVAIGFFKFIYYKFLSNITITTFSLSLFFLLIFLCYGFSLFYINSYINSHMLKPLIYILWLSIYVFMLYVLLFNTNERQTINKQTKNIYKKIFVKKI